MNSVWMTIISAVLCFILSFVVYHHYGKLGCFILLVWLAPGLIDFWLNSLSLTSSAIVYEKFAGLVQIVTLIAFVLWFRSRYDLKIEPTAKV